MRELWRGNANAWECDEMGHLNVKSYLAKAMQAVARLIEDAGLAGAFRPGATATVQTGEIHIRFLGEARPGAPLFIEGGFIRIGGDDADIALVMRHSGDHRLAATLTWTVRHIVPGSPKAFPWPSRFQSAAADLTASLPDEARPRGLDASPGCQTVSLVQADALDLFQLGLGRFGQEDADVFGAMRAECLLGKVSDSVANFAQAFPDRQFEVTDDPRGGALLEARIRVHRWPQAGDGFVVRSALAGMTDKVRHIVHWVIDPVTGKPWWTVEGIAATLNLRTRRVEAASPEELTLIGKAVRADLRG